MLGYHSPLCCNKVFKQFCNSLGTYYYISSGRGERGGERRESELQLQEVDCFLKSCTQVVYSSEVEVVDFGELKAISSVG